MVCLISYSKHKVMGSSPGEGCWWC